MNSLIAERELLAEIKRNIGDRAGKVWHIEQRMKRSINNTAKADGFKDVSVIPGRAKLVSHQRKPG
jgi:hypothetical protein